MTGCVFVGRIDKDEVSSLSEDLFGFGVEMAKAIQNKGREVENKLLTEIFDTDEK